jgi:hypothetical protein
LVVTVLGLGLAFGFALRLGVLLGLGLGLQLGVALWLGDGRRLCDGLAFREAGSDGAALSGLGVADAAVLMLRAVLTKNTAPQPPQATMKTTEQITATMPAVELGFRGGLATGPVAVLMRFPRVPVV